MITVQQLIKTKGEEVFTIAKEATITEGMQFMAEKQIGSLVVIEDGNVIGIFTERDFARKVGADRRDPETTMIAEIMTKGLITVDLDQTVNDCMALMTENRIRHLPVIHNGQLVGIVSIGDVVKDVIDELKYYVDQLTRYIQGLR